METPSLPFTGAEPLTRHCSYLGAVDAQPRAAKQAAALLELYRTAGPLIDHDAAKRLKLPVTTICARRRDLRRLGLIQTHGWERGPFGVKNTRHGVRDND